MTREISDDLMQAYASTLFTAEFFKSVDFKHGEANPKADAVLVLFDVASAALITAWNPYSEPRSDAENQAAQRQLEAELAELGISYLPAVGKGTTGDWPPEPSVLALGLEFSAAQALAVKYQQNAYLWIEKGFPAELIFPDPKVVAEQASITVLSTREQSTHFQTWTEYLCIRKVGEQIELSSRMYEGLAELSKYCPRDESSAALQLPKQIGGKAVFGTDEDAGVVLGGDLGYNNDDEWVLFDPDDLDTAHSWLGLGWNPDVLEKIENAVKQLKP